MIDLELQSVPAKPKQHALFIKRLQAEVKRPDSHGKRRWRQGFSKYGRDLELKEMEAVFAEVRKGDHLHHLEIQPDAEIPETYYLPPSTLDELVEVTLVSLSGGYTWVAVLHHSHGMFPHAHVFICGPALS